MMEPLSNRRMVEPSVNLSVRAGICFLFSADVFLESTECGHRLMTGDLLCHSG